MKKTLGGGSFLQVAFQLEYKRLQKLLKKKSGGGSFLQVTFSTQLEYKGVTKIIEKEVRRREFPPGYFVNLNIQKLQDLLKRS